MPKLEFPPQYYVTFLSETGLKVTVLMDSSPGTLARQSGWETVDRPKRVAMTRWKGGQPFTLEVPVLFDGVTANRSQESDIATLMKMADSVGHLGQPPKITVSGAVDRTDITWVIQSIQFSGENTRWEIQGGSPVRLRQAAVVNLVEFVDDNVIVTKTSPAIVSRSDTTPPKHVQVHNDTTLNDLAIKYFHDPSQWQFIWLSNSFLVHDPRAPIPKGTTVDIPGKTIVTVQ